MPLTLTPATDNWDQPSSATQSPIEPIHFENAKDIAKTLAALAERFIQAGETHLAHNNVSDRHFVKTWKRLFEECLNEFGANYNNSEDADNRDDADTELESTPTRKAAMH